MELRLALALLRVEEVLGDAGVVFQCLRLAPVQALFELATETVLRDERRLQLDESLHAILSTKILSEVITLSRIVGEIKWFLRACAIQEELIDGVVYKKHGLRG